MSPASLKGQSNRRLYPLGSSRKGLAILLMLVSVVIVSGCTSGGPSTGPGVQILQWEPDLAQVDSGEHVKLIFEVQNQGTEEALNVFSRLSGIDPNDWAPISPSTDILLNDLLPFDQRTGTPGATETDIYDLLAPELPEGIRQTYSPTLSIYYTYRTTASKQITIVNEDELSVLAQQGKSLPTQPSQSSSGPMTIQINTPGPVRAVTTGFTGFKTFPIQFDIRNIGGGYLTTIDDHTFDNKVLMSVDLPAGLDFTTPDCEALRSGDFVDIINGIERKITCEIQITAPPAISEQKNIITFLDYDYRIDRTTQVEVHGTGTIRGF
ncbi:MAG: hypothetical protein HY367_02280 [Candidatus Aenigmarchaeota archaeon]|nr:hypothetical protein [Candidatus Aenigmarchaeota archaeon]